MNAIFTGQPDKKFPFLKHGEQYDIVHMVDRNKEGIKICFAVYIGGNKRKFVCPYSNINTFNKNWRWMTNSGVR
jgi:hypothetical protein